MATMTSLYEATARNTSAAALAAALLAAVPALDPSVPQDKLGLAFVSGASATVGSYRAQVTIVWNGANSPDVVGQMTNLWTNELSKSVNTPVRFVSLVVA